MAIGRPRTEDFNALFGGGSVVGLSDRELLDRFLSSSGHCGEAAFEALVLRHGPMVWGVCRRILDDPTDADDAFQATFLVLVRRGRSVRVNDSLGRWLYGVGRKVAGKLCGDRDRRRRRESGGIVADQASTDAVDLDKAEILAALDDEVARLAEPFRSAVILCDLGGLTHEEAALELKCPVGTIKSRLARGRDRLHARLARLGVTSGLIFPAIRLELVPPRLVEATVIRASTLLGGGLGPFPILVSRWFSSTKGVHPMVITIPMRWLAATTLALGLGATCLMGLLGLPGPNSQDPPANPVPAPRPPDADRQRSAPRDLPREFNRVSMPPYVVEPPDRLVVEVLEALPGRPITGERQVRPDGTISLGYYGQVHVDSLTTEQIKVKVIEHLLEFLTAAQLGLELTEDGKVVPVEPEKSTRVFVDVVSFNSKVYYVQGDVGTPGRLPITGNERVLDAIVYAGGLIPTASVPTMRLVRPDPRGQGQEHVYPIDYDAIVSKGDTTTNYQLMPGDRVVVLRKPVEELPKVPDPDAEIQARFREVERKIDLILKKLDIPDKP